MDTMPSTSGSGPSQFALPSEGSSDTTAEDDEWKPCRRKPTRKVNPQRSQATKMMWKRKKAAAQLLHKQGHADNPCSSALTAWEPWANEAGWRSQRPQSRKVVWQQRRKMARLRLARNRARDRLSRALLRKESVFSICWSDTTLGSQHPGLKEEARVHIPKATPEAHRKSSGSTEHFSRTSPSLSWGGTGEEGCAGRANLERACRPKLFVHDESSSQDSDTDTYNRATAEPNSLRTEAPMLKKRPRLLQRESPMFTFQDSSIEAGLPGGVCESPCSPKAGGSKKNRLSLAAKLRWQRRRAKANHHDLPRGPIAVDISVASQRPNVLKRPLVLPAKLRWKLEHQHSMPAKLRLKQHLTWYQQPSMPSTNVEPPEINNGCEEEFVSQRSQAKRRWWQQMRNLTSQVNSGGPPVPLPKFLKAELCRADKAPEPVEGGALATSTTSRRSAAMKELWRKRKQAWLSAAAARAPAVPSQPEPQAQPCGLAVGVCLVREPGKESPEGEQRASLNLALLRCRQWRQKMFGGRNSSRHYTTRGIHIGTNKDVCDCMDLECPGCHFPCPKCGSAKCGDECRCSRNYVYEQMELEGLNLVVHNPLLDQ